MRALFVLVALVLGCDCGGSSGPAGDAGAGDGAAEDAGPEPAPTRVPCGEATLVVSHWPLEIALEGSTGETLLGAPAAAEAARTLAFATIPAPRPEEFFDPRGDEDVSWSPAGNVRSVSEGDVTVFDVETDVADTLLVEASCPEDGRLRLAARLDGPRDLVLSRVAFATHPDDRYHGLGEQLSGVDSRGHIRAMQLHVGGEIESGFNEVHVPVPFVVSPRGWGVFVESRRAGAFDVGATNPATWSATFDEVGLTLHLFAGSPLEIVAAYTRLTGLPKMPPDWAFGAQYWRNENTSGDEVLADAAELRARDIPTSVIWIDNPWQVSYDDFTFDEGRFPDAQGLVDALHARGFKVLLWSAPYLDAVTGDDEPANPAEALFVEAEALGYLATRGNGAVYVMPWGGGDASGLPDFTNPDAVAWFQDLVGRVTTMGVDGFKLDYGEEVLVELLGVRPGIHFANGETEATMHGFYSRLYHRTYQGALERDRGEGFVIGRASAWGGQADVDCIWPGDIDSDFSRHGGGNVGGLPAAVAALQSLAASGFPVFGSDTGGYREGLPSKEELLRWAAHTAFSPLLQLGGGGGAGDTHAPWVYDEEAVDAYRVFARWHVDLFPTLRALVHAASRDGTPVVRAMALAYPDDPDVLDEIDAYMLGPDLLVAPLVEGGSSRAVHLPAGRWLDLFTDEVHEGPVDLVRDTPLDEVPAYLRGGGVLVLGSPDVDTLVPTDAVDVVDVSDRADLRRVLAFGDAPGASVTAQPRVTLSEEGGGLWVSTSDPGPVTRLLFELHLPDAASASTPDFFPVPSPVDVTAGCGCWAFDADRRILFVGTHGDTAFPIE